MEYMKKFHALKGLLHVNSLRFVLWSVCRHSTLADYCFLFLFKRQK